MDAPVGPRGLLTLVLAALAIGCSDGGPPLDAGVLDLRLADARAPAQDAGGTGDGGELGCMPAQCASPPPGSCADATHLPAAPGSCGPAGCVFAAGAVCANGCWQGACNASGPSVVGVPTAVAASTMQAVTLAQTPNLDASTGSGPAGQPVTVSESISPPGAAQAVTLTYTVDDFATTQALGMVRDRQAGGSDVYVATIPAQPAGKTVRFFVEVTAWPGDKLYDPGNFKNHTYATQ